MRWVGEISSLFWPMAGPAGVESLRRSLDETKTSYAAQNSDSREPAGGDSLGSSRGLMTLGDPVVHGLAACPLEESGRRGIPPRNYRPDCMACTEASHAAEGCRTCN